MSTINEVKAKYQALFTAIADAIRQQEGTVGDISPDDFAQRILDLSPSGERDTYQCPYFDYYPHQYYPKDTPGTSEALNSEVRFTAVNTGVQTRFSWCQGYVTSINVNIMCIEKDGKRYYCMQHQNSGGIYYAPAMIYGILTLNAKMQTIPQWPLDYYYYNDQSDEITHETGYAPAAHIGSTAYYDRGFGILPGGHNWLVVYFEKIA